MELSTDLYFLSLADEINRKLKRILLRSSNETYL